MLPERSDSSRLAIDQDDVLEYKPCIILHKDRLKTENEIKVQRRKKVKRCKHGRCDVERTHAAKQANAFSVQRRRYRKRDGGEPEWSANKRD